VILKELEELLVWETEDEDLVIDTELLDLVTLSDELDDLV